MMMVFEGNRQKCASSLGPVLRLLLAVNIVTGVRVGQETQSHRDIVLAVIARLKVIQF